MEVVISKYLFLWSRGKILITFSFLIHLILNSIRILLRRKYSLFFGGRVYSNWVEFQSKAFLCFHACYTVFDLYHSLLMVLIEEVGLTLLDIGPVLDLLQRKKSAYCNIFNAWNIEIPSFSKGISNKLRNISLPKNVNDLLSVILWLFSLRLSWNGMLVYLFP